MVTRRATWAASAMAGVILLAAGFWVGRSQSTGTATPDVRTGTVRLVAPGGDGFAIQLSGTQATTVYAMRNTVQWRNKFGTL